MTALPNFLYLGPAKAGSTWMADAFRDHPEIYVPAAKDLYFFDRYFEKGTDWYASYFERGRGRKVLAEFSHDYLYSSEAPARIREVIPDARLMVCLREPISRAFSVYLYYAKFDLYSGSFEEALEDLPELLQHGRYSLYVQRYLDLFPREQIYFAIFEEMQRSPQGFIGDLFEWLGVARRELAQPLLAPRLPAARARSRRLARVVKAGALNARKLGMASLVGKVKGSRLVERTLYREFRAGEKPKPEARTISRLRQQFAPEVARLRELTGSDLSELWGYG